MPKFQGIQNKNQDFLLLFYFESKFMTTVESKNLELQTFCSEIHLYSWCFLIYSLTFKSKIVLFSLTTIFANNLFSLLIPSATKLQILWDPKCKKETSNSQIHWSMSSISSKNRELLPKILKTNLTDN